MKNPSFSVITVSFNQGEFIRQTIESVLAQEYENFEHIVVDGGSTDETLSILREYPHLKWTSEPDRGQSHALNKGFARARGDIIAWINSDDWYAPGTFHAVAEEIGKYPVVMGSCIVTDRDGTPKEEVPNYERSWFDTLKYWVYHSVPTQPGIFFRRELLDRIARPSGDVFDEELYFTMDFDLWLRMQERHPFIQRVPRVFSYVRVYESNKTGADMAGAYREMARVYRRHSTKKIAQERAFAFVIPVTSGIPEVTPFLRSISQQTIKEIEVIFADSSNDRRITRTNRKRVFEYGAQYQGLTIRHVVAEDEAVSSIDRSLNAGIRSAASPVTACLRSDREVPADFAQRALQLFARDNLGLNLPSLLDEEKTKLFSPTSGVLLFNPVGPLTMPLRRSEFIVRTIAWLDCREKERLALADKDDELMWKRQLLMMAHKAWMISAEELLPPVSANWPNDSKEEGVFRLYTNSVIIDELGRELSNDLFAALRAKNGFAIAVPEELAAAARFVVNQIPNEFLGAAATDEMLQTVVERYPNFGPARYLLARFLAQSGRHEAARSELERWRTVHELERQSPLYGL